MLSQDDSPLHTLWNLYRVTLYDGITAEKFADVYAQTFTYGLFLAWLNTDKTPFDRETALRALPRAVPPIRVLLQFGGGDDLPEAFHWIVNGICSDLEAADKEAATKHPAGIADPLIYFYETFLSAYDPALRERAGVYYTPDPVVDFLVRAVDDLLRRDFGKDEGLADPSVRLLNPPPAPPPFWPALIVRRIKPCWQTVTLECGPTVPATTWQSTFTALSVCLPPTRWPMSNCVSNWRNSASLWPTPSAFPSIWPTP